MGQGKKCGGNPWRNKSGKAAQGKCGEVGRHHKGHGERQLKAFRGSIES